MTDPTQAERIRELEHQLARHRRASALNAAIEQARGMLMMSYGVDEARAAELLDQWSKRYDINVWVLATTLVHLGARTGTAASDGGSPAPATTPPFNVSVE